MAFQKNYRFTPWNNNNNSPQNFNRGFNNNQGNNRPIKKRSGAKSGISRKDGKTPYVRGWKYDKTHGLRAFIAAPYKGTHRVTSKSGREWENWFVKVTTPQGVQKHSGLYDVLNRKVIIKDLGIVMNPAKDYTGPYYRRK